MLDMSWLNNSPFLVGGYDTFFGLCYTSFRTTYVRSREEILNKKNSNQCSV